MELISSWEQRGIEQALRQGLSQGLRQGKEDLVVRLLNRRLGASIPVDLAARMNGLTSDQWDDLGEALLDFTGPADLERWLTRH